MLTDKTTTDFGYREVPVTDKAKMVHEVFANVAPKYDLMNDLMSLGLHRIWKKYTLACANIRPGQVVLDVASGTGDLAKTIAKQVGPTGKVYLSDINEAMLTVARDQLTDAGQVGNTEFIIADAQTLPFADNYFDCITLAFGLRNMTHKDAALASLYRVLKPGGKLFVLEFSHPHNSILRRIYDLYSFKVIPKLGEIVAHDRASYQYLVESIRRHPTQDQLKELMQQAGFEDVTYHNFHSGIVALHIGCKY